MTDPTGNTTQAPLLSPYRLTFEGGPSWLSPASGANSLSGFSVGARLGQSYSLSERWRWAIQGVFSYSNYYAEHGNLNRIGIGFETGPEVTLVPNMLGLSLYAGLQQGFYYSQNVSWPSALGHASFDNTSVAALSLRPEFTLFGGMLTAAFEYGHDFGLSVPGPTMYDSPVAFSPNRYSLLFSFDFIRAFYAMRRNGFTGASDSMAQFITGIKPSALVEGSYNYSFNNPSDRDGLPGQNTFRTNTPFHNRPRLNLLQVGLERPSTEGSPFGFKFAAGFGQDPVSFAPRSSLIEPVIGAQGRPDTQYFALQQAYLTYRFPVLDGLTFQAGQFGTTVGNEIPEGPLNTFLIPSRGLNNTLAEPFYHAGAGLRLRFQEETDNHGDQDPSNDEVTSYKETFVGVVNGWDSVLGHEGGPTVMLGFNHQLNTRFNYALNYLIGAQDRGAQGLFNFNALYKPVDELSLGTNLDFGHGNNPDTGDHTLWFGLGLYQQYNLKLGEAFTLAPALREEVFTDPQGARTGTSQTLLSVTGALNALFPYGFGLAPEIRHDHSVGRDAGVEGPFFSGNHASESNTTFMLRAFWRYPFN